MSEEQIGESAPAAPAPVAAVKEEKGVALASWEAPHLPFRQRLHKYGRQMLVRLWGPVGSVAFHIVALGVLMAVAVGKETVEVVGEKVMIDAKAQPEQLDKQSETEKIDRKEADPTDPITDDNNPSTGLSDQDTTEPLGGSGTQNEGTGMGTGPSDLADKGFEINVVKSRLTMRNLYAGRTAGGRKGALGMYGHGGRGDAGEAAVLRALRWLKKNQTPDGSWAGTAPPAMTAFALLAYLAHGETPDSQEFGPTVRKAIDWFVANQEPGGLFRGRDGNNYSQPIAAYALCEAYGLTQHPTVKDMAVKAVTLVVKGQKATGAFNYQLETVSERNDSSYMAWCCQALKAAKMAGLENDVPGLEKAIKMAIAGFKLNADPSGGFGYTGPGRTGLSGAGALCMQLLGAGRSPEVKATMAFLAPCTFSFTTPDQQPYGGGSQLYYWYYITQAKFHDSKETFMAWDKLFSPELCKTQMIDKNAIEGPDGKLVDIGHWESPSKGEHHGGVVQDTAFCTLMLEVYYRYLPTYKPVEAAQEDVAAAPKNEDIKVTIK